ncbi:hypothetical protein AB0P21_00030 [Kribbella sp. NPDC056861]
MSSSITVMSVKEPRCPGGWHSELPTVRSIARDGDGDGDGC